MKILVAEDSASFGLLYKTSLEKRGHTVTVTEDGVECFYKYSEEFKKSQELGESTYDLVILDHLMPKMKGLDVAKEILRINSKQRILLVTAHVQEMMKDVRELPGEIELMSKPFPSLAMIRQVEGLAKYRFHKRLSKGLREWDADTGYCEPLQ
ncbi:MAG: response regulator [Nitrosopumilaceae archaeon]